MNIQVCSDQRFIRISLAGLLFLLTGLAVALSSCQGKADQPIPATETAAMPTGQPSVVPQTPEPEAGTTLVSPVDQMVMVYVPAGEFLMGSDDTQSPDNERPQHTVYLDGYWIDRTEVTVEMYAQCVSAGACTYPYGNESVSRSRYFNDVQYAAYPVLHVDWGDAQAYCEWAGRRLPSEAEWEKAARGTDGRTYPWGNEDATCALANLKNCTGDTVAVGSYPEGASPYGALDMAGNVFEWVNDWYVADHYTANTQHNPAGPSSGTYHVFRGGSWDSSGRNVRSTLRDYGWYEYCYVVGFRCAVSEINP